MTLNTPLGLLLAGLCAAGSAFAAPAAETLWEGVAQFERARVVNSRVAAVQLGARCADIPMRSVFLHPLGKDRSQVVYPPARLPADSNRAVWVLTSVGIRDGVQWDHPQHPPDGVRFYVILNDSLAASAFVNKPGWVPLVARAPAGAQELRVTLADDAGPRGDTSYDWALFGDPLAVAVDRRPLPANQPTPGAAGVLIVRWPAQPKPALIEGLDQNGAVLAGAVWRIEPRAGAKYGYALFDFSSVRACVQWRWRSDAPASAWGGSWRPQPVLESFNSATAVCFPGEPVVLRAGVANRGRGSLLPSHRAVVSAAGQTQPFPPLAPGERGVVEFRKTFPRPGEYTVAASAGGRSVSGRVIVWPRPPRLAPRRPARARVQRVNENFIVAENPSARWLIYTAAPGLAALVDVWTDRGWERAGAVAPWARCTRAGAAGPGDLPRFRVQVGRTTDAGAEWTAESAAGPIACKLRATVSHTLPAMRVRLAFTARAELNEPILEGPAVRAGEGASGVKKDIAIFPGLEYLEDGEPSSSTRDLAPPLNERWMPHKFTVTVPFMFVQTRAGGPLLGVAWDPRQKWDGEHDAPAARFASPDFLDHGDSHLMQLLLPNAPDFLRPNRTLAAKPYAMPAGRTWRLDLWLAAGRPQPDATAALEWFQDLVGYPDPEPWPRSFKDEMALCRRGFMVSCWDAKEKKNLHCVGRGRAYAPGHAALMLLDARIAARGDAKRTELERVRFIAQQIQQTYGVKGFMSPAACHILRGEFPYHWGGLPQALDGLRRAAYNSISSQQPDGSWIYTPDKRRSVLGPRGAKVVGICARHAYVLAKWLAISGDPAAERALRRALKHMERYRVPRGAQGWECPIYEPDVLAAAYAVRTYVWTYMATGERKWLDRARFWARTGLPFQYAWDDGQHPGMRYASIPVFGSTFFRHTWIGLPVQWCGLVYAYSLVELSRFDSNPLWRKQIEGVTASALYQQWPMDAGKLAGTYPDSFGAWFTRRNPVYINPEDIAVNVLAIKGLDPGLRSVRVALPGGPAHAAAACELTARRQGSALVIDLKYLPNEIARVTLAPVKAEARTRVRAAGRSLPRRKMLLPGQEGWAYDAELAALAAAGRCDSKGRVRIEVEGAAFGRLAAPAGGDRWEFEKGLEGWSPAHACRLAARNGVLLATVTGADPYFLSGPASIDASRFRRVRARVKLTGGDAVALYWRTSLSPLWSASKHVTLKTPGDGAWREIVFDLSDQPLWAGAVVQLRIDPEPASIPPGSTLAIDWIRPE